jgi:hypothetical protein
MSEDAMHIQDSNNSGEKAVPLFLNGRRSLVGRTGLTCAFRIGTIPQTVADV